MVRYTPMMRAPVLDTASSSSRAAFALGSAACVGALTFGAARYMRSSRLMCSDAASDAAERAGEDILLANISVGASHMLLTSPSSVAFSGLQPIVPGHSIVAPLRPVGRAPELSDAEWLDLWRTARRAQAAVEARHGAGASNLLLKDGTARLPHLHAHVVPRLQGDFAVSDTVFGLMDGWAPTAAAADRLPAHVNLPLLADDERKDRTSAMMADEAAEYRALAAKPKVAPP
jgi:bis(5'-adenosyl)-triphosphatase